MKMFSIDRNAEVSLKGGPYLKVSPVYFFDIRIGRIEIKYETNGWGDFNFIPEANILRGKEIKNINTFVDIEREVLKMLERCFIV